jgi:hypothetical protein
VDILWFSGIQLVVRFLRQHFGFCFIAPAGEYRIRPGAGVSRSISSEDANAPALSPYEMRTRKRIVHIMQVHPSFRLNSYVILLSTFAHLSLFIQLLRSQDEPVYVVSATMLLQHLRSDGFSEDSLTTDALVRVLRDAIRCGELVRRTPIPYHQHMPMFSPSGRLSSYFTQQS